MNNLTAAIKKSFFVFPITLIITYLAIAFVFWDIAWLNDISTWHSVGRFSLLVIVFGIYGMTFNLIVLVQIIKRNKTKRSK